MRKDAGTYGDAQRIEQLAWMFFLKIFDDRETEQELMDDDFKSPLPKKYRWRNWASDDEGLTGDKLLDFIDNGPWFPIAGFSPGGFDCWPGISASDGAE